MFRVAAKLQGVEVGTTSPFDTMNAIYQANTFATEMSVVAGAKLFQICGAKSTRHRYGADRFWRDARALLLHDNLARQRGITGCFVLGVENPSISTRLLAWPAAGRAIVSMPVFESRIDVGGSVFAAMLDLIGGFRKLERRIFDLSAAMRSQFVARGPLR